MVLWHFCRLFYTWTHRVFHHELYYSLFVKIEISWFIVKQHNLKNHTKRKSRIYTWSHFIRNWTKHENLLHRKNPDLSIHYKYHFMKQFIPIEQFKHTTNLNVHMNISRHEIIRKKKMAPKSQPRSTIAKISPKQKKRSRWNHHSRRAMCGLS